MVKAAPLDVWFAVTANDECVLAYPMYSLAYMLDLTADQLAVAWDRLLSSHSGKAPTKKLSKLLACYACGDDADGVLSVRVCKITSPDALANRGKTVHWVQRSSLASAVEFNHVVFSRQSV